MILKKMFLISFVLIMLSGTAMAANGVMSDVDGYYMIEDEEDLFALGTNPYTANKNYKLAQDIEMTQVWSTAKFYGYSGTFDGNGYTIQNFTIENYGTAGTSPNTMFYSLNGGTIKDLNITVKKIYAGNGLNGSVLVGSMSAGTIEDVHVTAGYNQIQIAGSTLGGIVGSMTGGEIKDSSVYALSMKSDTGTAGGIVGYMAGGTVKNTTANVSITAGNNAGGIAGQTGAGLIIKNCYSMADVLGGQYVGGISGDLRGKISNSFAAGNIIATAGISMAGGISGCMTDGEIENCYSTSQIYSQNIASGISTPYYGTGVIKNSLALNEYLTAPNVYRITKNATVTGSYSWEYMTNNGTQIPMEGTEISMDDFWNTYNAGSDIWNTWSDSVWALNTNENFLLPVLSKLGEDVDGDMSWVNFEPSGPEVIYKTVGGGGSGGTVTLKETVYVDSGSGSNGVGGETPITPANPIGFGNEIEPESGFNVWIAISGLLFATLIVAGFYIRKCQKDLNERRI